MLFDLDFTLIRCDSFAAFLRHLIAADWRRAAWAAATAPALPLLWLHPRLILAGASAFSWIATVGAREPLEDLADRFVAREFADSRHVCAEALARLREHQAAGDRVIVVTGAAELIARRVCATLAGSELDVVGSTLRHWRGGWIADEHCYGAQKVARLAAHGVTPPWDTVYTDSASDLPLLRHARRRVLVNPRASSRRRVTAALGGDVEIMSWR